MIDYNIMTIVAGFLYTHNACTTSRLYVRQVSKARMLRLGWFQSVINTEIITWLCSIQFIMFICSKNQ